MRVLSAIAFLVCLCVTPFASQAYEVRTLQSETTIFDNVNCEATQSCSLKRVRFYVRDYHLIADIGDSFGTSLYAWYETDSLESLEEYVFVQFIRGCVYDSNGEYSVVDERLSFFRELFGKRVTFKHSEWVIDSYDRDPIYRSTPGRPRHFAYSWNTPPFETLKQTERYYGLEMPRSPILYINNYPMQAMHFPSRTIEGVRMSAHAYNVSLEFRIGIYRSKDVPFRIDPYDLDFAKPLFSVSWNSSFIYNHETGEFEQPDGIVSVCR